MQKGFSRHSSMEPLPEGKHDIVLPPKKGGSAYSISIESLAKYCQNKCRAHPNGCSGNCEVVASNSPGKKIWRLRLGLNDRNSVTTLKEYLAKKLPPQPSVTT